MLRKITLVLSLIAISLSTQASHLVGGEITWETTPNGQYIFTLTLYRDCSGINLPTTPQIINGPNGNISCSYIASLSGSVAPDPSGNNPCLLERGIYRSVPYTLVGVPPQAGWDFSWSSCCRPVQENTNASGFYIRSKMYPYTPPGASAPLNVNTAYDNSPEFLAGFAFVATQGPYSINHQGVDRDQDSLAFSFASPLDASNSNANFNAGYHSFAPFPDASENSMNGPNTMDPLSGIIDIETYNASTGFYMNCIKVDSYRNGQLISSVFKELPLYIDGTAPASTNLPPLVEIDTAQYPGLQRNDNTYRITAMNGDILNFAIQVSDNDTTATGGPQTFCLNATGNKISSGNLASASNCPGGGPCATISPLANTTYCATLSDTYNFNWSAQCSLLSAGLLSRTTYVFHIYATDNGSPAPKSQFITLLVDLFPSQTNAPNLAISGGNTSGDVDLQWTPNQAQAASPFGKYMIYANQGPGTAFSLIDSVVDRNSTTLSLSGLNFPSQFYMNQITGSCRSASENSDTISSAVLGLSSIEALGLSFFPQPASDKLQIESKANLQLKQLNLLNSSGALIRAIPLNKSQSQWSIDLQEAPGLYLLEFVSEEGVFREKLLIKS